MKYLFLILLAPSILFAGSKFVPIPEIAEQTKECKNSNALWHGAYYEAAKLVKKNGDSKVIECLMTASFVKGEGVTGIRVRTYGDWRDPILPDLWLSQYYLSKIKSPDFETLSADEQKRLKTLSVYYAKSTLNWRDLGLDDDKAVDRAKWLESLTEISAFDDSASPNLKDKLGLLRLSNHNVFDLSACEVEPFQESILDACTNPKKIGKPKKFAGKDSPNITCTSSEPGVYELDVFKKVGDPKKNQSIRKITVNHGRFEFAGLRPCESAEVVPGARGEN